MNQYEFDIIRERAKIRILYFLAFGIMFWLTSFSQVEGRFVLSLVIASVLVLLTIIQIKDYRKAKEYLYR